jgi:hemoglobin
MARMSRTLDVPEEVLAAASPSPRAHLAPGVAVGISEPMIRELVRAFYARVRLDPQLGPIFNREVDDWDAHLAKLGDFWSSVMLMTGRFKGRPMAAHAAVGDITPAHFAYWLELFAQTAGEVCPPAAAELFAARARTIGQSLQMGLAIGRGEPPAG